MVIACYFINRRRLCFKMVLPACRIKAAAQAMRGGIVQNILDPAAHAVSRGGFALPNRRDAFQHQAGVNVGNT